MNIYRGERLCLEILEKGPLDHEEALTTISSQSEAKSFQSWKHRPPEDSTHGANFKMYAFASLKVGDNLEKIAGLRVALWTQHAHQAFG